MGTLRRLRARAGVAVPLRTSQTIKVVNTHGKQVVDFWAIVDSEPPLSDHGMEYMSMSHTRTATLSLSPSPGTRLVTNKRQPILEMVEDTSPGIHDTLIAACDPMRYRQLGVQEWHASCAENFHLALKAIGVDLADAGVDPTWCPDPLNLFMNIPVSPSERGAGKVDWGVPESKAGDHVVFKALRGCVVVMSACPQDLVKINDEGPRDVEYVVETAA